MDKFPKSSDSSQQQSQRQLRKDNTKISAVPNREEPRDRKSQGVKQQEDSQQQFVAQQGYVQQTAGQLLQTGSNRRGGTPPEKQGQRAGSNQGRSGLQQAAGDQNSSSFQKARCLPVHTHVSQKWGDEDNFEMQKMESTTWGTQHRQQKTGGDGDNLGPPKRSTWGAQQNPIEQTAGEKGFTHPQHDASQPVQQYHQTQQSESHGVNVGLQKYGACGVQQSHVKQTAGEKGFNYPQLDAGQSVQQYHQIQQAQQHDDAGVNIGLQKYGAWGVQHRQVKQKAGEKGVNYPQLDADQPVQQYHQTQQAQQTQQSHGAGVNVGLQKYGAGGVQHRQVKQRAGEKGVYYPQLDAGQPVQQYHQNQRAQQTQQSDDIGVKIGLQKYSAWGVQNRQVKQKGGEKGVNYPQLDAGQPVQQYHQIQQAQQTDGAGVNVGLQKYGAWGVQHRQVKQKGGEKGVNYPQLDAGQPVQQHHQTQQAQPTQQGDNAGVKIGLQKYGAWGVQHRQVKQTAGEKGFNYAQLEAGQSVQQYHQTQQAQQTQKNDGDGANIGLQKCDTWNVQQRQTKQVAASDNKNDWPQLKGQQRPGYGGGNIGPQKGGILHGQSDQAKHGDCDQPEQQAQVQQYRDDGHNDDLQMAGASGGQSHQGKQILHDMKNDWPELDGSRQSKQQKQSRHIGSDADTVGARTRKSVNDKSRGWPQQSTDLPNQENRQRDQNTVKSNESDTIHRPAQQSCVQGGHRSGYHQMAQQHCDVTQEPDPPFKGVSCAGIKRGTLGRRSIVETNYFTMDLSKMPDIAYHYDVAITPGHPKRIMRTVFACCQSRHFPNIAMAFDGAKSCYTVQRLKKAIYTFTIKIQESIKEYTIQIKETETPEVELKSLKSYHYDRVFDKPMRALQALEVVLSHTYHDHGIRVGRSFYHKPAEMYDLKDGYEMYTGIYQAAILGEEPLLNIDIAHKSFPKAQNILKYLQEIGVKNLDTPIVRPNLNKVAVYLKGINILYKPPECFAAAKKYYKICGVGDVANKTYFTNVEGRVVSVWDHYNSRGYKLIHPLLNCLQVTSGSHCIALPMELCDILDYEILARKDTSQITQMMRHSASSTTARKNKIMNILKAFRSQENLIIERFGVRLGRNFIKVQTRLLPSPDLQYFGGITKPKGGTWQITNGFQFLDTSKPADGHKWAIIYDAKFGMHTLVYNFQKHIYTVAQGLNVRLAQNCKIDTFNNIDITLKDMAREKIALVIVIIPSSGTTYSNIKQSAELKHGVLTQCIKERTVERALRDMSICNNLLLKINTKLNGTNHRIAKYSDEKIRDLMKPLKNVMFLGADVTHPSPDQNHIPSVVGVAASHDYNGACYNMQYRLQRANLEDIEDMEGITIRHLLYYKKYLHRYPDYIIYYRDGVSDGQFPIIRDRELRGIRAACKKLNCNAKLTCIVVVKRHHTRFFPLKVSCRKDDFNNVEPGTVVDQRIVHPNEVQFFLVSHQANQGTAKPTRYNVIEDDAKFNVDLLQKLTYDLCHLFPRCNRAVSYPAPAYLAHLVAYRGRVYLEGGQEFSDLQKAYEKRLINSNIMDYNPMYFV